MANNPWNPFNALGQTISNVGTALRLPEMNISERLGYGPSLAPQIGPQQTQSAPGSYNVLGSSVNNAQVLSNPALNQSRTNSTISSGGVTGGSGGGQTNIPPGGQMGAGQSAEEIATEQARIELENEMNAFNQAVAEAEAQKGELAGNLKTTLSGYETQRQRAQSEAGGQLTSAEQSRLSETNKATRTAKDVQSKNRNILRAMGILSSSAAGEMLGRPYEELQGVTADIGQAFTQRKQQVEDWLKGRNQDIDTAIGQVQQNYDSLIGQINRDIRYTGQQKASAVKEAQNALRQTIYNLQTQAQANQQAAAQYQANLLSQVAQLKLYQNPSADVSGIMSQLINVGQQGYSGPQASIYGTEESKKRLNNALSGLGANV